jgi:tetratricopeptide (TPR) repeat protein
VQTEEGKALEASHSFRIGHHLDPENPDYEIRELLSLADAGVPHTALRRRVAELSDRGLGDEGILNLSVLETEVGLLDRAETRLRAATARNPEFVPYHLALGSFFERKGNRSLAWKAYENAHRLSPRNEIANAGLARLK